MIRHEDEARKKRLAEHLERAEAGDAGSAHQIENAEQAAPETAAPVEQEAADGPRGRGLAR